MDKFCYAELRASNFAWVLANPGPDQVGVPECRKNKEDWYMESNMKKTKRQNLHNCCPVPGFMGLDGCA